jgi:hypothetical protein
MQLPDKNVDSQLNFGCGAALGFVLSFLGIVATGAGLWTTLGLATAWAVGCGVVTAIFGDRALVWILELIEPP